MNNKLLKIKEVADWAAVSPRTVQTWVANRTIPYLKIGRLIRFKREDIEEFITEKRISTAQEMALGYNPLRPR